MSHPVQVNLRRHFHSFSRRLFRRRITCSCGISVGRVLFVSLEYHPTHSVKALKEISSADLISSLTSSSLIHHLTPNETWFSLRQLSLSVIATVYLSSGYMLIKVPHQTGLLQSGHRVGVPSLPLEL